jgi:putative restriction endonuclease
MAPWEDPDIGCILLVEPFFWPEELWIPQPADWHPNIQRGRTYGLRAEPGRNLWKAVADRLQATMSSPATPAQLEIPGGWSDPVPTRRDEPPGAKDAIGTSEQQKERLSANPKLPWRA